MLTYRTVTTDPNPYRQAMVMVIGQSRYAHGEIVKEIKELYGFNHWQRAICFNLWLTIQYMIAKDMM